MNRLFKFFLNTIPRPVLISISKWLRPILVLFYKGDTYTDPIDGRSYRRLLPYGYQQQRGNVLSPGTLSLERHRLLWLYLQQETTFFSDPLSVLHMAPEQCFVGRFRKQKNLTYTTADLESPLADVKADICDLPFADNTFDMVICNHVLEHIPDDKKAMEELYRVMKKGGMGIFQVPMEQNRAKTYEDPSITSKKDRTVHFGQYDHVRVYGMDYFDRLRTAGFEVHPIDLTATMTDEWIECYALVKGELLPVCRK